jgi:catechol 2,3-dioxygenase-like lactoylglutathione lyase family enzyme
MSPSPLINIDVDDLQRAVSFYTAALGRKLGPSVVELLGDGSPISCKRRRAALQGLRPAKFAATSGTGRRCISTLRCRTWTRAFAGR